MNFVNNSVIQGALGAPCIALNMEKFLRNNVGLVNILIAIVLCALALTCFLYQKRYKYANNIKTTTVKQGVLQSIIPSIIYAFILTFLLAMLVGYKPLIVTSGSMRPSIEPGAVILIKQVELEDLEVGDVITFHKGNTYTTHQIIAINKNGFKEGETIEYTLNGQTATLTVQGASVGGQIITHGTGNQIGNPDVAIKIANVDGKVCYCIWYLGLIIYTVRKQILQFILMLITIYFAYVNYFKQPTYNLK